MSLLLYAHPFSSYCQKVLIALYENGTPFELKLLSRESPEVGEEHGRLWPIRRMPTLADGGRTVVESSIIIEHLGLHHPGPVKLIPSDPRAALDVRMLDRCADQYLMTPMQKIVFDAMRPPEARDALGVAQARELLDSAYAWFESQLPGRVWAAGDAFSLADCAAAPALFYADWVHPIDEGFRLLRAYRQRLLGRPSYARAVDEARPYRKFFPLGAPDRD